MRDALAAAWRIARRELLRALGRPAAMDSLDRRLLEGCILAHYAQREDVRSLLFVGTRWYTRHYHRLLPGKRFLTIDVDPAMARHGSPDQHIVDSVCRIGQHLAPGSVDVVIFNGVFGWGLDEPAELQAALEGFEQVLRAGGELVLGWNDIPRRRPFDWWRTPALQRFAPMAFAPLGEVERLRLPTDNRHCFEFFRKPCAPAAARPPERRLDAPVVRREASNPTLPSPSSSRAGAGAGRGPTACAQPISVCRSRSDGNSRDHAATTIRVPMPPSSTEPTGPSSAAVAPDSNSPS